MSKTFKFKVLLSLIFLIFLIIYINILSKNKGVIILEEKKIEKNNSSTVFLNVEYKFADDSGKIYTLKGAEANILISDPDLIQLKKVNAFTSTNDGSILKIDSDYAKFFKNNKNVFFSQNIVIANKDMVITSNNAKFLPKKNRIEVYGNVILKDSKNKIKCDNLIYETDTKNIFLKMNTKEKQVYGKRKK